MVGTATDATGEAGQTTTLSPVVKDGAGNTLNGRTVVWTTSDASKATVDGAGVVKGVAVGTAIITATSEGKSGTATVNVVDTKDPELLGLTFNPANATVSVSAGPATVVVTAHLRDGSGIARFDVRATAPTGGTFVSCMSITPASGTVNDGIFSCTLTIPQGAPSGAWTLTIGVIDMLSRLADVRIRPSRITVQ
jgi:hypothetical protein